MNSVADYAGRVQPEGFRRGPFSFAKEPRARQPPGLAAPLSSAHIRASWRSSSSSQPRVAASWNIAWNSVESIVGTLS